MCQNFSLKKDKKTPCRIVVASKSVNNEIYGREKLKTRPELIIWIVKVIPDRRSTINFDSLAACTHKVLHFNHSI
jgi:hypothetical protein